MAAVCTELHPPREFSLIARHFRPLAGPAGLDLLDDAALLAPPSGREMVIAADAMVAGVHCLADDPPGLIARKLLRVNLSDLAAMGAIPLGYLLTLAAPRETPDAWFAAFAAGLAADQAEFGLALLGGDTTATPGPLCLSLTILGHVAPGRALRRAGARAGDGVWVSGSIGDAALGLAVLTGRLHGAADGPLAARYHLPQPRLALGQALAGIATACLDVSDGLVQDLGHLCRAAGVTAEIAAEAVPRSPAALAAGASWLETCLTGGDDYELLFAVPATQEAALQDAAARAGVAVSRIGAFRAGPSEVILRDGAGAVMRLARGGWSHF